VLLDTHVLLWWQAGGDRLSSEARRRIERADAVLISPISIWEAGMLVHKGRVAIDRDLHVWVTDLFDDRHTAVASLTPQAAASAALLVEPFPGDPADRLIYATGLDLARGRDEHHGQSGARRWSVVLPRAHVRTFPWQQFRPSYPDDAVVPAHFDLKRGSRLILVVVVRIPPRYVCALRSGSVAEPPGPGAEPRYTG
jgi:PIN domain nuclease of toxin-antitoxin system